jgi:hypothetical protein
MKKKISEQELIKFINESELLKIKDRIRIIEMVSDYFRDRVDGNDTNRILREHFGR